MLRALPSLLGCQGWAHGATKITSHATIGSTITLLTASKCRFCPQACHTTQPGSQALPSGWATISLTGFSTEKAHSRLRLLKMPAELVPETVTAQLKLEAKIQPFFSKLADFDEADQQDSLELLRRLHIRYLQGGLGCLPAGYVSLDSGRPWICYWILHSLALLDGPLPDSISSKDVAAFLSLCQSPSGGYGGGPGQLPHLAPSYAAVAALVSLGDHQALSSIHRDNMLSFLKSRCVGGMHGGGFAVCEGTMPRQAQQSSLLLLKDFSARIMLATYHLHHPMPCSRNSNS